MTQGHTWWPLVFVCARDLRRFTFADLMRGEITEKFHGAKVKSASETRTRTKLVM